jgi:hypothetical protein
VVINHDVEVDIEHCYTLLSFIEALVMSHSTSILSEICKYYYARTSRMIVHKVECDMTNASIKLNSV